MGGRVPPNDARGARGVGGLRPTYADHLRAGRDNAETAVELAARVGASVGRVRGALKRAVRAGQCMCADGRNGAVYWLEPKPRRAMIPRDILGVWPDSRVALAYDTSRRYVAQLRQKAGISPAPRGRT